jgi:hypothetical protein
MEFDALIASRVMKHKLFYATPKKTAIAFGCKVAHGVWIDTGKVHEWGPVVTTIPLYSADLKSAWLVVDKLAPTFLYAITNTWRGRVSCKFFNSNSNVISSWKLWATADTVSLAICSAAILAIEGVK